MKSETQKVLLTLTEVQKSGFGISAGSCTCASCGWGCAPACRQRCRCAPAPPWTSGLRCCRCTTGPIQPATPAPAGLLWRSGQVTPESQHHKGPTCQRPTAVSYPCKPVSLQSPVLWPPAERRPPSAGQLFPPRPSARQRPEPVYSGRGRHTAPSPDSTETEWKSVMWLFINMPNVRSQFSSAVALNAECA